MSKIEEALAKAKAKRGRSGKESAGGGNESESGLNFRTAFQEVSPDLAEDNRIVTLAGEVPDATEQFRMLRTQILQKTEGNGDNCLMVTSSVEGEGKSTTAINLAVAIAKEVHTTVLLVDTDLRRPSIHKYFGLSPEKGLVQYLLDNVPLEETLIRTGVEKLTFLPAGGTLTNSAEILRSRKMRDLIREVKERYRNRYIIFDSTPLLSTTDPTVLSQFMDGIIFVVQAERTSRNDVAEALELLQGRNILGVVMNNLSRSGKSYSYGVS